MSAAVGGVSHDGDNGVRGGQVMRRDHTNVEAVAVRGEALFLSGDCAQVRRRSLSCCISASSVLLLVTVFKLLLRVCMCSRGLR